MRNHIWPEKMFWKFHICVFCNYYIGCSRKHSYILVWMFEEFEWVLKHLFRRFAEDDLNIEPSNQCLVVDHSGSVKKLLDMAFDRIG